MKRNYKEEAQYLALAAKIGVETLRDYGLTLFPKEENDRMVRFYLECEYKALNREPQFENLKSLKYLEQDIFTFFQEYSGSIVNLFWDEVRNANLPFERINRLGKILKKRKISTKQEYDYVTDTLVPFSQEGRITESEATLLKSFIGDYEQKCKR